MDREEFVVGGRTYVKRRFYAHQIELPQSEFVGGATVNRSITIEADSDFVWQKGTFFSTRNGAAHTWDQLGWPYASVQIVDTGTGRNLFEKPVPVVSQFGTGQFPYVLPIPRVFHARQTITFQVNNRSAVDSLLELSLIGFKAYPRD